jgi:hypothetical protein
MQVDFISIVLGLALCFYIGLTLTRSNAVLHARGCVAQKTGFLDIVK